MKPLFLSFIALASLFSLSSSAAAFAGTCAAVCESAQVIKVEVDDRRQCHAQNPDLQPVVSRYCVDEATEYVFVPGRGVNDVSMYSTGACLQRAVDDACGGGTVLNCAVTELRHCAKFIQGWPSIRCLPSPYVAFQPNGRC